MNELVGNQNFSLGQRPIVGSNSASKRDLKQAKSIVLRLALVFAAILLTRPFCTATGISIPFTSRVAGFWIVSIPIFYLLFARETLRALSRGAPFALLFFSYIVLHTILDASTNGTPITDLVRKNGLLLSSFGMFIVLVDQKPLIRQPEVFFEFVRTLTLALCFYGFYQAFALKTGLPVLDADLIRGRSSGFIPQACGFFEEPAFFAQYLIAALYILLNRQKTDLLTFAAIFASIVIGRSVGGLLATTAIVILDTISVNKVFQKESSRVGKIFAILALSGLTYAYASYFGVIDYTTARINSEVIEHADVIGTDELVSGSGGGRVINEINMLIMAIRESPLIGLGADTQANGRLMGLNAVTETVFRYGLIGIGIFAAMLFHGRRNLRHYNFLIFWSFMALFTAVDGAISKPIFWILLSLVMISEKIRYEKKAISTANRIRRRPRQHQFTR
jgi:hypothetical protein